MAGRLYWFAGGGTGGHLFPGIAVAERLQISDPDARIVFVGSDRPIERDILAGTSFEHHVISSATLTGAARHPGHFSRRLWKSYRIALRLIDQQRPQVIIGCGGFASAAPVLAAWRRRVPILLLEQNVIPGRATRWLSRLARTTCLSFEQTDKHLPQRAKTVVTGNPVRTAIAVLANRERTPAAAKRTLLILGGSQGAQTINECLRAFVVDCPSILSGWRVVHQTGRDDLAITQETYAKHRIDATVSAFFADSAALYREADLAVSRAGGTTLAELACAGIPAILIPYPHATANHQWHNAAVFRDAGAAVLVESQHHLTAADSHFRDSLQTLLQDDAARTTMADAMVQFARPQAADQVADLIRHCSDV